MLFIVVVCVFVVDVERCCRVLLFVVVCGCGSSLSSLVAVCCSSLLVLLVGCSAL